MTERQCAPIERALELGFARERVVVIDARPVLPSSCAWVGWRTEERLAAQVGGLKL